MTRSSQADAYQARTESMILLAGETCAGMSPVQLSKRMDELRSVIHQTSAALALAGLWIAVQHGDSGARNYWLSSLEMNGRSDWLTGLDNKPPPSWSNETLAAGRRALKGSG